MYLIARFLQNVYAKDIYYYKYIIIVRKITMSLSSGLFNVLR